LHYKRITRNNQHCADVKETKLANIMPSNSAAMPATTLRRRTAVAAYPSSAEKTAITNPPHLEVEVTNAA
jgi:hypothetical protein